MDEAPYEYRGLMSVVVGTDLAAQLECAEAAGHEQRVGAIGHHTPGCLACPVACHRLGINRVPLQFTQPAEETLTDRGYLGFQRIQGRRPRISKHGGQSDARTFGHLVVTLIHPANQQAHVAHPHLLLVVQISSIPPA